jgi:hypothetical protein
MEKTVKRILASNSDIIAAYETERSLIIINNDVIQENHVNAVMYVKKTGSKIWEYIPIGISCNEVEGSEIYVRKNINIRHCTDFKVVLKGENGDNRVVNSKMVIMDGIEQYSNGVINVTDTYILELDNRKNQIVLYSHIRSTGIGEIEVAVNGEVVENMGYNMGDQRSIENVSFEKIEGNYYLVVRKKPFIDLIYEYYKIIEEDGNGGYRLAIRQETIIDRDMYDIGKFYESREVITCSNIEEQYVKLARIV